MDSDQDKNKNMETDAGEIDNSEKKPIFRYRRLYDDFRQKSSIEKTLAFFKTWSWLLVLVLLLISIILMVINHFIVNIYLFFLKFIALIEFSQG